jgi:hypothetical protein
VRKSALSYSLGSSLPDSHSGEPMFDYGPVHMGFVANSVVLGEGSGLRCEFPYTQRSISICQPCGIWTESIRSHTSRNLSPDIENNEEYV